MKGKHFFLFFFVVLQMTSFSLSAQNERFSSEVKAGLLLPLLDGGGGIHVGYHPVFQLRNFVSLEGQLSHHVTRVTSSFLSGKKRNESYINGLAGVRLFLHKPERPSRVFINFLIGVSHSLSDSYTEAGISTGLHLLKKTYTVGLVLESPGAIIAKVGYVF